ncbi:15030_t:CDS:2 [Gigaspora margarita]|uniref:15030_t:CDS:1 n=1 Tax=Gigaspora margarita TaxID=4874 RepID=A0ABN7UTL8_GIGMA|nr:15030_t:CDS:2 [Gigaspora margarita]
MYLLDKTHINILVPMLLETTNTSAKCKAEKGKGDRPNMLIWDNYSKGKEDGHGHFGASCHYYEKGK